MASVDSKVLPKQDRRSPRYDIIPTSLETRDGIHLQGSVHKPKHQDEKGAVIIHHGINGNRHDWKDYASELAEDGFLTLTYDARGHNQSEGEFDAPRMVDDISTAIDHLDKEYGHKGVGVIGYCLGGMITSAAAEKDDRIRASISLGTPSSLEDVCETKGKRYAKLYQKARAYASKHRQGLERALNFRLPYIVQNAKRYSNKRKREREGGNDIRFWEQKGLRVPRLGKYLGELLAIPATVEHVKNITTPYTVITGTCDGRVTPKQAERLYDSCGSSKKELIILEGDGHAYAKTEGIITDYAKQFFTEHLSTTKAANYGGKKQA